MIKLKEFWEESLENKGSISLRSIQRRLKSMNEEYGKDIRKRKDWKFNTDLLKDIHFVKELLYPNRHFNEIYKWNNFLRSVDVWEMNNDWTYFGCITPLSKVEDEDEYLCHISDCFNKCKVDYIITKEWSMINNLLHYHFVLKKNKDSGIKITKNLISTFFKNIYGKDGLTKVELPLYEKEFSETYRDKGNSVAYILKSFYLFNGVNSIGCYNTPQWNSIAVGSEGVNIIFK